MEIFFSILLLQIAIDLRPLTGSKLGHIYCTDLQKDLPTIFWERHVSLRSWLQKPRQKSNDYELSKWTSTENRNSLTIYDYIL